MLLPGSLPGSSEEERNTQSVYESTLEGSGVGGGGGGAECVKACNMNSVQQWKKSPECMTKVTDEGVGECGKGRGGWGGGG